MTGTGTARLIPAGIRSHDGLISEIREMIGNPENGFREYRYAGFFPGGWSGRQCEGRPAGKNSFLVMAGDTGIELGAPSERSASLFLWSWDEETVPEGIWIAAPDLASLKGHPVPYAQVVMAQLWPGTDPLDTGPRNLMGLANRIPGCMTRSLQGRIWMRIHRDLVAAGFSLPDIGEELVSVYREEARDSVARVGVVIVAGCTGLVARIEKIQAMARVVNGENRKLQLEEDGTVSCEDLDCGTCGEKQYCDTLREVIKSRRRKS